MDVVIVEDERLSADKLQRMIGVADPQIEITAIIDSVRSGVEWFKENSPPDLIFLDIQLSDGTAFDLLKEIGETPPIIFTTAYDQYAIRAFKYNSIDYLLKPLDPDDLEKALLKYSKQDSDKPVPEVPFDKVNNLINGEFKKRFLVKVGEQFQHIDVSEIAYFRYDDGLTYIYTREGKKWPADHSLDNLENILHPLEFFRINRKMLIALSSINQIHTYFNSRLLLRLNPGTEDDIIVSRDRVADFKRWMDL